MQSAVTSALVQPLNEIAQQLQLTCRSGNCTWPTFDSLAVCSSCNDVHSYLNMSAVDIYNLYLVNFLSLDVSGEVRSGTPISRPTLPNGLFIDTSVQMTTFGTGNPHNTVTMQDVDTLIWSMSVLREKQVHQQWRNLSASAYEAVECALSYCARQYSSEVVNNRLEETSYPVKNVMRAQGSW